MNNDKDAALAFLQTLERSLRGEIPKGTSMDAAIRNIVSDAKKDPLKKHMRLPEAAFLNHYVLPSLFCHIQEHARLSESQAKDALLNEYHRTMPEFSRLSPIHSVRHPFRKTLGAKPENIYRQWLKPDKGDGLTQSCPDFALRKPFPYSIVFEGKYFRSGSLAYAAKELVADLYQAFFYRGLPKTPPKKAGLPEWNYDYACLLAFDASHAGTFRAAWDALNPSIRRSFWEGANIYVMILGGQGAVGDAKG